ncbi:MAG: threonine dehydratase [Gemmatimonadales bacterium]|nr:threonine dehydratase [Gemmatimonadales bacterium]
MPLPTLDVLEAAARVVHAVLPPTPQYRWPLLSARAGCGVWVKHENHTPVGAFKVRGGLVYLDALARQGALPPGIVSATRGNHGQSLGFAAARHGVPVTIVVPHGNAREKNAAMQALGCTLVEHGEDFQAATEHAAALAAERGLHRVPSFDPLLVAGVGTYALELLRAVPSLEVLYVPVGLGSGVCGVLAAKAALGHRVEVVGVVSAHAPTYAESFAARAPVSAPVTTVLADGMACRTPVPEALEVMLAGVSRIVSVSDDEVAEAMRAIFRDTHNVAEGAGAAGFAALWQERAQLRGREAGFVLCGANVDSAVFAEVLAGRTPRV